MSTTNFPPPEFRQPNFMPQPQAKKSSWKVVIILVIVLAIIVFGSAAVAGWYFLYEKPKQEMRHDELDKRHDSICQESDEYASEAQQLSQEISNYASYLGSDYYVDGNYVSNHLDGTRAAVAKIMSYRISILETNPEDESKYQSYMNHILEDIQNLRRCRDKLKSAYYNNYYK